MAAEAGMSSGAGSSTDGARGKKGGHKGMGSSSSGGVDHTRRGMYEEFVKGKKRPERRWKRCPRILWRRFR